MSESNNATVTTQDPTANAQERTFTQEEVNAIIGDRLAKERSKYAGFEDFKAKAAKFDEMEEASKTELQKATERADALAKELDDLKSANQLQGIRAKVAEEMKVPASLLTGTDEESCKAQAQSILEFANATPPQTKVKDNGEVRVGGGAKATRDIFADAFDEAFNK